MYWTGGLRFRTDKHKKELAKNTYQSLPSIRAKFLQPSMESKSRRNQASGDESPSRPTKGRSYSKILHTRRQALSFERVMVRYVAGVNLTMVSPSLLKQAKINPAETCVWRRHLSVPPSFGAELSHIDIILPATWSTVESHGELPESNYAPCLRDIHLQGPQLKQRGSTSGIGRMQISVLH